MSKRQSKTGVQHLVYQAKTGFQFYFTFPSYIGNHPQLPAQIRWSLGHDEALARDLAQYLNPRFEDLLRRSSADTIELDPEGFLLNLATVHAEISRFTESHLKIWALRPAPAVLANSDLSAGHERLLKECQEHTVLYCNEPGGEIHFALYPSEALRQALKFGFTRFDWPLGTNDHVTANAAAAYIYSAITVLETTPMARNIFKTGHPLITMLSFYEYLCFARPDQGSNLLHIPPGLPRSAHSVMFHLSRISGQTDRLELCQDFQILQEESGLYTLLIPLTGARLTGAPRHPDELRVELLTSSPILASILMHFSLGQIDKILVKSFIEAPSADAYERALQEIQDLIRRMLGPIPPAEPMYTLPDMSAANDAVTAPQDAGTLALLNALGSVLSPAQNAKLQALFEAPASNDLIQPPLTHENNRHFGALTREFEERQVREGAWKKAHLVFYVNGTNKKPEKATAEKIRSYLRLGTQVCPLVNVRGNADAYEFEEDRESLTAHGDSTAALQQTEDVLRSVLGSKVLQTGHYVQGLLAFSSLASDAQTGRTTIDPARSQDLVIQQRNYQKHFASSKAMYEFSQIKSVAKVLHTKLATFREDMIESNKTKVYELLVENISTLQALHAKRWTMTQGAAQWIASIDSRQASPVRTVLQHPWRPTFIPRNIQGIYAALRWQRHIVHRLRLVCPAFAALARHTRIGSRAQSNTHRDTSVSKCNAYIHHMEMSNMHARKSLLALLTTAALSAAGAAHAGPPVAITIKNLGTADAAYSIVGSNETSTYANATPKPAASVPPGATNTYSVQSTISPDVNYAVVRYKIGNKTCVFNTNYVNGYTSGGIKVPSWNKSYTASGGATCTATITSTNISTHAWAVEFTIK